MSAMMRVRTVLNGWQGGPGLSTVYFAVNPADEPVTPATVDIGLAGVRAAWAVANSLFPTIFTALVDPTADILDPATGLLEDSVSSTPVAVVNGAEGPNFGPASSGICVNLLTSGFVAGHRVRGRTFLSPTNNGDDANGSPTAAQLATAVSYVNQLIGVGGTTLTYSVWHRPKAGVGGSLHAVTSGRARDAYSVLTSRRG